MGILLFVVISVVLLGNQYLHKTDNGDILRISADNGTSSLVLANTTLVCWLICNICRNWKRYWISCFALHSPWNQCLICCFCPSFVDRISTRQAQLRCLLTKSLLFCDTAIQRYKCTLHPRMKLGNKGLGTTERLRERGKCRRMDVWCLWGNSQAELGRREFTARGKKNHVDKKWMES